MASRRPRMDAEKNRRRQLKCINGRCRNGYQLVPAYETVCKHYGIEYKSGNMVCRTCLNNFFKYYQRGEKSTKEEDCIMISKFPNFEPHLVIDLSSDDEFKLQSSASVSNVPTYKKKCDCLQIMLDHLVNYQAIIDKQLNYHQCGKKSMKEKNFIIESKFSNFESHLVIDLSSDDELKLQSSASEANLSTIKNMSDCLQIMLDHIANKYLATNDKKLELCNYIDKLIQNAKLNNAKLNIAKQLNIIKMDIIQIKNKRKEIISYYKQSVTNQNCVNINDTAINIPKNKEYKKTRSEIKKSKGKCVQEIEDKTAKEIIAVNHTPCDVPDEIPKPNVEIMEYPSFFERQTVYAKTGNYPECWQRCIIGSIVGSGFIVVRRGINGKSLLLHPRAFAYASINSNRYHVGCRVISKYANTQDNAIKGVDHFYAGVIAESPSVLNSFRYLIFFDNARVQYRHHKDIRLIAHNPQDVCNEINSTDSSYLEFLQQYLENYPERHMVRLTNKHNVTARSNGLWMSAKVVEVDASLVRLKFMESKEMEWLYRGSLRLLNIHDKLKGVRVRQSGLEYLNQPFVEFTTQEEPKEEEPLKKKNVEKKLKSDLPVTCNHCNPITTTCMCSEKNIVPKRLTEYSEKQPTTKETLIKNKVYSKVVRLTLPDDVPKPQSYFAHNCNHSCVAWTHYDYSKIKHINILRIPLHFGFCRLVLGYQSENNDTENTSTIPLTRKGQKCVFYRCPCGRTTKSMKEMLHYLMATNNKMTIEMFDFNSWVEPLNKFKVMEPIKVIEDLSYGKEFKPISCVNTISDKLPPSMNYITSRQPMLGVSVNTDPNFLCGCDCTDDCQDKSKCACWQLTVKNQKIIPIGADYYDPNVGYNYRRLPDRVLTGIYECNITCKCSKSCLNRVAQQPLSHNLQLYMTEEKGWGVRCLNDIPSGSFICIYVGHLLTENDANLEGLNYGDEYLAELDYIEVVEDTKEGYENTVQFSDDENSNTGNKGTISETSNDDYQAPNESANKGSKRIVQEYSTKNKKIKKDIRLLVLPEYKAREASPKLSKSVRDYFGEEENVYILDAKISGNIGRYINHSCNPNLFVQNVFVDTHDIRFPWISFFAIHFIRAGTELTWDYSYDIGSVPGKKIICYCKSTQCRKRLL